MSASRLLSPVLAAAIDCGHAIEDGKIILYFEAKKPGHNALDQLGRRLEAAAAVEAAPAAVQNAASQQARQHRGTVNQLSSLAAMLERQAAEARALAETLSIHPEPVGEAIVQVARMLRKHGLCVVDRNALQVAMDAMMVADEDDITEQSGQHLTFGEIRHAKAAVDQALTGNYPTGLTSAQ